MGLLPSASLGDSKCGLYEPIHGSAPDIAGKNMANPIGMIASVGMMLAYSFDCIQEAQAIEQAIQHTLDQGFRTKDIEATGTTLIGTKEMGDKILKGLHSQ